MIHGFNQLAVLILSLSSSCVSSLLSSSAPGLVNVPTDDTDTTLLHLAANSTPAILQLLLENEADVNHQNEDGFTALHVAAMWGNSAAIRLLLDYGADPLLCDDEEMTALNHAVNEGTDRVRFKVGQVYR